MFPPRATELAHALLREIIRAGDTAIDATAGHGHDTAFLAETVGPHGRVLAIDLQHAAIASTRAKLSQAGLAGRVEFHQTSHARLADFAAPGTVAAVMFNLGYLPGGDHGQTTMADETLAAIDAATVVLKSGGALTVVCYPGHPAGAAEAPAVEDHLAYLTQTGWRVAKYAMLGTLKPAPYLLVAGKA